MRLALAEKVSAAGEKSEEAGDGDARIEIGVRDSFTRGGRSEAPLRRAHIGTILHITDRQLFDQRRIRTRREIDIELARLASGEHRKSIDVCSDCDAQRRKIRIDR